MSASGKMRMCGDADVQQKIVVKHGPNPMLMFRANTNSNPNTNP